MASDSLGIIVLQKVVEQDLDLGVGQVDVIHPSSGKQRGDQVNLGTFAVAASMTWNPGAVSAGQYVSQIVPCVGASPTSSVALAFFTGPFGHQNHCIHAEVVTKNEVLVIVTNNDAINPLTIGSGTLKVLAFLVP